MDIPEQLQLLTLPVDDIKPRSQFGQWMEAFSKYGLLFTPSLTESYLGLSKTRVHQLLTEDRIPSVRVCGHRMVPLRGIEAFKVQEKSLGGQHKRARRITLRELLLEGERISK